MPDNETNQRSEESTPILYHYTSQRGLMGILEKGELWASDVRYLNDSREFIHALELAEAALQDRLAAAASDAERALLAALIDRTQHGQRTAEASVFAASLTAHGDLLSQWLSYCPSGAGYAIGFDVERLVANALDSFFVLRRCEYELDAKKVIIDRLVDSTLESFRKELGESSAFSAAAKDKGSLAQFIAWARSSFGPFLSKASFWSDVTWQAAVLKHESFRAEDEWRLVPERPDQTLVRGLKRLVDGQQSESFRIERRPLVAEYREGRSSLVPYVPVSLRGVDDGKAPVVQIIVGPTRYPNLALSALQRYTEKLGYVGLELKLTQATYREI